MSHSRPVALRIPRWWWPTAGLAILVALYSLRYVVLGERAYLPELAASFRERPGFVLLHTLFGPLALTTGLVNLLPQLRVAGRWRAHRVVGRVYGAAAVLLAGAALVLAPHALGGTVARTGFLLLAVATLVCVAVGYRAIRHRRVRAHREWMLRSYALIFGAVTLRLWLPLLILAHGGDFLPAYQWVAWVSWVPNLLVAEWIIQRGWHPRYALRNTFRAADGGHE